MQQDSIYLHFLDREACRRSRSYGLPTSQFVAAFQTVALTSFEPLVLSGGHLFEHKAAHVIYRLFPMLFVQGQVRPVASSITIDDFVIMKIDQYGHLRSDRRDPVNDYSIYFGEAWRRKFDLPIHFLPTDKDTSSALAEGVARDLTLNHDLRKRAEIIISDRRLKAITLPLFRNSSLLSQHEIPAIADAISRNYTAIYRKNHGSWIYSDSGLISKAIEHDLGLEYSFPAMDAVAQYLDLGRVFSSRPGLGELRGSIEHVNFVRSIRRRFASSAPVNPWMVREILAAALDKRDGGKVVLRALDVQLQSVSRVLDSFGDMPFDTLYVEAVGGRIGKTVQSLSNRNRPSRRPGPKAFIVVAVPRELSAVRQAVDAAGYDRREEPLAKLDGEIVYFPAGDGKRIEVGLLIAASSGKGSMANLLNLIDQFEKPELVIMVGMMAAIKGKSKLLDVIAPRTVYDVSILGTKGSKIIAEPETFNISQKMRQKLAAIDWSCGKTRDINVIIQKKTAAVSAKIDDITHDLAQSALSVDRENVVGLEMEGAALCEKQESQSLYSGSVHYLMIKGTADYAGDTIDQAEASSLRVALSDSRGISDGADPTNDPNLKKRLQVEATRRAFVVCERVIESWFRSSRGGIDQD